MQCSTDQTSGGRPGVQWRHGGRPAVTGQCKVVSGLITRYTSQAVGANTCVITGLGNATIGNQGPYECSDDSEIEIAEAAAILIGMQLLLQFMNLWLGNQENFLRLRIWTCLPGLTSNNRTRHTHNINTQN